ncbi:MAG: DNA adenine methylase [Proteobacteria bacterium]|nr:DNA adenine methylase [Pseudomonadota bacterium]
MNPLTLQPIPYQGSKRSLAPRICRLIPKGIDTLYEPFAGSAAISLYAANRNLAKRFVLGDVYPALVSLWTLIIDDPEEISGRYKVLWDSQFSVGPTHFNEIRARYNADRDPTLLLYLIARCVKNAIRFNRHGDFTQSVDKRRNGMHPKKFTATAHKVSALLRGRTEVVCMDFADCITQARTTDLVYMDPPYQGTTYGRDKRYAAQLERERLIASLANLNQRRVPFILSYDGKTGDKEYGERLPESLKATHLYIHAGRSSQATLTGRSEETLESIYISADLVGKLPTLPNYEKEPAPQIELFAQ